MTTPTSRAQIDAWLAEPEGTRLEFKEARNDYDHQKLLKYCVALANEGGGKVILGVTDKRPRTVVGTRAFADPGRIEGQIFQRLHHRVPIEEQLLPEGRLLIVHVPSRLPGAAWQLDGQFFKRAGDELVGLADHELRAIFQEVGPDFSALPCVEATPEDLDRPAIARFREKLAAKAGDSRRTSWTDDETLRNMELIAGDRLTYASLLLFGTHSALGRLLPQAELVFEFRTTETSGPADERREFRSGLFLFLDELWERINLRNTRQSYQDGLFRLDVPTFDEAAIREGLLNALTHRDYRLGGSIFVVQHQRRISIVSPGGFPPGARCVTPSRCRTTAEPPGTR